MSWPQLNYGVLRESTGEDSLTVLVMKNRTSKAMLVDVVEVKGRGLDGDS